MSDLDNDRTLEAFKALVRAELDARGDFGVYEYVVKAVTGFPPLEVTVSAEPSDPSLNLPPVHQLSMRASITGGTAIPSVGNFIHLAFLNGDRTRPIFVGGDQNVMLTFLDASNPLPLLRGVARVG